MSEEKEERPFVGIYPPNVENGISIFDIVTFRTVDLLSGIAVSFSIFGTAAVILNNADIPKEYMLTVNTVLISLGLLVAFAIAIGRNGDPLTVYLMHMIRYQKTRRSSIYNPRVKKEAKPFSSLSRTTLKVTPRARIDSWMKKHKEQKVTENFQNINYGQEGIVFDDDAYVIEEEKKRQAQQKAEEKKNRKKGKKGRKNGRKEEKEEA